MAEKVNFDIEELGFVRIAAASPFCTVADIAVNTDAVLSEIRKAEQNRVNVILFPQLVLTSASCGYLFKQKSLLQESFIAVKTIARKTADLKIIAVVGFPILHKGNLYSAEAVIHNGHIAAIVPMRISKMLTPFFSVPDFPDMDYIGEENIPFSSDFIFTAKRLFSSFSFTVNSLYYEDGTEDTSVLPRTDFILAPLAEPSYAFSFKLFKTKYRALSKRKNIGLIVANCGAGESTTDYVFAGETGIFEAGNELESASVLTEPAENFSVYSVSDMDFEFIRNLQTGNSKHQTRIKTEPGRFIQFNFVEINVKDLNAVRRKEKVKTLLRKVHTNPFLPECDKEDEPVVYKNYCFEIIDFQVLSLAKRLKHLSCTKCVLGISGGSDSTLALLSALKCFDILGIPHKNLYAVSMPCFGTTEKTKNNAVALATLLDCTVLEIPIRKAVELHLADIGHEAEKRDITYENAQARERTQVLMDKANQVGGIMLGTGDLSEAALGWTTYNGDHISMYELNSSIPKTLIKVCINFFAENKIFFKDGKNEELLKNILSDIISTPVSPELLPPEDGKISQKTENIIGAYELHDFFLYHTVKNAFSVKKVFFLASTAFKDKYSHQEILDTLKIFYKRFFSQQFKRSCSADGADVIGFSLSPRSAWVMPSDSSSEIWLGELEFLSKIV
ncbi:NAD(+) synthase [Treponema pedis]|uniref:Glutamine-dependent NAD(+) synthetase n=1 Tax=Treponema pedis str. T A4 TaxID=1291379 RepID=S5ZRJ7_9SPIR|nr:NAD(+) synthase [Treponema pedis]AGT42645.1 NAD synthetase [Treponema pedis str. T A4]